MDRPKFETLVEQAFQRLRDLNSTKGKEYAGDEDVLSDFKEVAASIGISPEQALLTYMTKHWRAINSYVQHGSVLSEPIAGRIDDLILYGHLLQALIQEKCDRGVTNNLVAEGALAPRPIVDRPQA